MLTRFCISCGEPFHPTSLEIVICPACGGPIEAVSQKAVDLTQATSSPPPMGERPPSGSNWQVGDVILDTYEVKQIFTSGGMGLVYRVHHKGWNIDLVMKSPRANIIEKFGEDDFIREANTWVELGLHPHIVSCYYVRKIDDLPRVFAEYVEGGSMKDWIEDKQLYEGGKDKALQRILDIAIQFAWGLAYAHEQGLVHQDVKPGNVLITLDGMAKVTDFGLAKARAAAGAGLENEGEQGLLVSAAGGTPAFRSPEQSHGERLSLQTDIWSWALSILEMFAGEMFWRFGEAADDILESFLDEGAQVSCTPPMPEQMVELLRQCFRRSPTERPKDLLEIAGRVIEIYQQKVGEPFPRLTPKAIELRADSLNNKALSLLDLGQLDRVVETWREALGADPHHVEATYNLGLWLWRSAEFTDLELVEHLEAVASTQPNAWMPYYLLTLVHLQRRDTQAARHSFMEAKRLMPNIKSLQALEKSLDKVLPIKCTQILKGHKEYIKAVAITPDGRRVISASVDDTLRVWDLTNGKCLCILEGNTQSVNAVAITPDGQWAVSGGYDNNIRIWELNSGVCLRTIIAHAGPVEALAITPDGRCAVLGSWYEGPQVWDITHGEIVRTLKGNEGMVHAVAITPDGRYVISGGQDKKLRLWNLQNGDCLVKMDEHSEPIKAIAISSDGQLAVSGSDDCTIKVWEIPGGACRRNLIGHTGPVTGIAISAQGNWVISSSEDMTLRIWDLNSGICLRTLTGHKDQIETIALTLDGHLAVSGSVDKTLRVWELIPLDQPGAEWQLSRPPEIQLMAKNIEIVQPAAEAAEQALRSGEVSEAGTILQRLLKTSGFERNPHLLDLMHQAGRRAGRPKSLQMARLLKTINSETKVWSLAITHDGSRIISGSHNTIQVIDISSGTPLYTLQGHSSVVNSVTITSDESSIISGSWDKTLKVWDTSEGTVRFSLDHRSNVNAIVTPDERYAISWSQWDDNFYVWELTGGKRIRTLKGHTGQVTSVAVTPDGLRAVSGSWDQTLRIWDLTSGNCLRVLEGHDNVITAIAISPDGQYAISASYATMRIWDLKNGVCRNILNAHSDWINAVAISPDGRLAISCSNDNTIKFWDLVSGSFVRILTEHKDQVLGVAIAPDGRYVVSGSHDRTLRIWILDWDYEFPAVKDWDEGARLYLDIYLTLHMPYDHDGFSRHGKPTWTEADFQQFLVELGYRGYGWLRPDGVRKKLEEMAGERG